MGRRVDEIPGLLPRVLLPDAKVLLPHRHLLWAEQGHCPDLVGDRDSSW